MNRHEVSEKVRMARTLEECQVAANVLADYLCVHPDDDDLRDEGSGLYMKMTALQQTAPPLVPRARERCLMKRGC